MSNSDIFGLRPENRRDTAAPAEATATAYNPFDALGVVAAPMEAAQITTAFRRAHVHLNRATATGATPMFPTAAEINAARDYLQETTATPAGIETIAAEWRNEARTFFAERAFGDANVFTATTATPNAGPTPIPAGVGARARRSPTPETPRKAPRNTATATPRSGQAGSQENPVDVDDDDDDDDDDDTGNASYRPAYAEDEDEDDATTTTAATASATPPSAKKPANRSSGTSARATAAANPNVDLEIVVGEWAKSTATPRNAVIARLDSRGRLNFRVVARTVAGVVVPGPTATATGYANIILVGQYRGMTYHQLRAALLRALSHRRELN
jgi:hypothetical protein